MNKCIIDYCPECLEKRELRLIDRKKTIEVRGEDVCVPDRILQCQTCQAEFYRPDLMLDSLALAYEQYRENHGWLRPDQIRNFRKTYALTQKELAALLGFGAITLSRYESGALQDKSHETMLRLAMQPSNLLLLLKENQSDFTPHRKAVIQKRLQAGHLPKWPFTLSRNTLVTVDYDHSTAWLPCGSKYVSRNQPLDDNAGLAA